MRAVLVLLLFLEVSPSAEASVSLFYAIGPVLETPGSVRLGYNEWEAGMLSTYAYGFDKVFPMSDVSYMAFGPVMTFGNSLGFYGSVGRRDQLFWILSYRVELQSVVGFNGFASGSGLLGLTADF